MVTTAEVGRWQPQEEGYRYICELLEHHISPTSTAEELRFWQQLQYLSHIPDFNNYLAFILSRSQDMSVEVRQAAGLLLKNNLRSGYPNLPLTYQQYIKMELLRCLCAPDRHIRSTVGTIISVIVSVSRLSEWPELLSSLISCLDSNDLNLMEVAMDALSKICEDIPIALDSGNQGLDCPPINILLPRFLKIFQSPHASLRKLALNCVHQYIMLMPLALQSSMNQYLEGLFVLARDSSSEVRRSVSSAFVHLVEIRPEFLEPHLKVVIEYILLVNNDENEEVALEACEFWSAYCDNDRLSPKYLRDYVPQIISVLLTNMAYSDDDEALLEAEDDESIPDRDQDMKPRFHSSKFHGSEDMEDDNEDVVNAWNLRKCSAAALDSFSKVFGDEILSSFLPIMQAKLSASGDEAWKEREVAVLAIGAVSEGCINGLYPHLPQMVDFLISLLDDKFPLIRSITCWTLSRYSKYLIQESSHQKGCEQFDKILMGLLRRILDSNKRVQEAACSAFASLEEILLYMGAAERLMPHLEAILQHLMCAFGKYQKRNQHIVYDAIGTLADSVGAKLNQPQYLEILMPPLIAKWQKLSDADKELLPLLECFTSIALALGKGLSRFSQPAFQRCIAIIEEQQLAKASPCSTEFQYDGELVVCALDLLSGLTEGLGNGIESVVSGSALRDLLLQCCMDDGSDVRQSAFAFLGDLAKVCSVHLHPRLLDFLHVSTNQLNPLRLRENASAANNACWAIGELAIKVREEVSPVVATVISCLIPVLHHADEMNKSLVENSAITIGRLAWVCPEIVSPQMDYFMQPWCLALSKIRDDVEKEDGLRGLCSMARTNPRGTLRWLAYVCEAIASWQHMRSEDLYKQVCQVVCGFKEMLKNGGWDECMSALEPAVKEKLSKYHHLYS